LSGFDRIEWPAAEGPFPINKDEAKRLLRSDVAIRLSAECQQLFNEEVTFGLSDVGEWAQKRALEECGYEPNDRNLLVLRSILSVFAEDEEIQQIPFYSRYNRCKCGDLAEGSDVPNISLVSMDGATTTKLADYYTARCAELTTTAHLPMVVIGGSYS